MNRRGFLGAILAAATAPAIVRIESLMPVRQLMLDDWLPTASGVLTRGNTLLTIDMITREALRVLEENLVFARRANIPFQNMPDERERQLVIRLPEKYSA